MTNRKNAEQLEEILDIVNEVVELVSSAEILGASRKKIIQIILRLVSSVLRRQIAIVLKSLEEPPETPM